MRFSDSLIQTYRERPSDCLSISQELLLRGGFVRYLDSSHCALLPLGAKVFQKLRSNIRKIIVDVGGQELLIPAGSDRQRTEGLSHIAKSMLGSYRRLPCSFYSLGESQIDESYFPYSFSIKRVPVLDWISFQSGLEEMAEYSDVLNHGINQIFEICGLDVKKIPAINRDYPSLVVEDLVYPGVGNYHYVQCDSCQHCAELESAGSKPSKIEGDGILKPLQEVATPGKETIIDVADFLDVETSRTIKAVFYDVDDKLVFVIIRGDYEVSEIKLRRELDVNRLKLAGPELLEKEQIVAGYASACSLGTHITVLADHSLKYGDNYIAGANKPGIHLRNVNIGRDIHVHRFVDISTAKQSDMCLVCGIGRLDVFHGIKLGSRQVWGTTLAESNQFQYMDSSESRRFPTCISTVISLLSVISAVVESHHDNYGIKWPAEIAPAQVHLISLAKKAEPERQIAEELYGRFRTAGLPVIYDDRDDTAGVKFNDADLLGVPIRVTVSRKSIQNGGAEMKARGSTSKEILPLENAVGVLNAYHQSMTL